MDCKGWDKVSHASFSPSPAPSAGTEQQEAELARYLALDAAVLGGDLGVDVGGEGARAAVHAVQALDVLALLPLQRAEGAVGAQVHVVPPEVVTHLGGTSGESRGKRTLRTSPQRRLRSSLVPASLASQVSFSQEVACAQWGPEVDTGVFTESPNPRTLFSISFQAMVSNDERQFPPSTV